MSQHFRLQLRIKSWPLAQRTELQTTTTQEVERHRELQRASRYVLDNVDSHPAVLDHLRHALDYRP